MPRSVRMILAAASLGLAACGTDPQGRVEGGTAAGAATGAGIGALAGPPGVLVGGIVGAGAGALGSSLTTPDQVNLGDPPWRNPEARPRLN